MATKKLDVEVWKAIPGIDHYEASNLGRIRSVDHYVVCKTRRGGDGSDKGFHTRFWKGKILTPYQPRKKWESPGVGIGRPQKTFRVPHLVMLAFVGPRPEGMEVCHNDGNSKNSVLSNLRYDTPQGNNDDQLKHGTRRFGAKNNFTKLTLEAVMEIRKSKEGPTSLSKKFGISKGQIWSIRKNRSWTWVDADDPEESS